MKSSRRNIAGHFDFSMIFSCISVMLFCKASSGCVVRLQANGFDDNPSSPASIATNGNSSISSNQIPRGVALVTLNPYTCTVHNLQVFDTYALENDVRELVESMNSAAYGTILVGVSADSAEGDGSFYRIAGELFSRYDMNITGIAVRDKIAFVMQKGFPKKTLFRKGLRYGPSLQLNFTVTGTPENNEVRFIETA